MMWRGQTVTRCLGQEKRPRQQAYRQLLKYPKRSKKPGPAEVLRILTVLGPRTQGTLLILLLATRLAPEAWPQGYREEYGLRYGRGYTKGYTKKYPQKNILIRYRDLLYWNDQQLDYTLLDLRQPHRYSQAHIPGAQNLPARLINKEMAFQYTGKIIVLYTDSSEFTSQTLKSFSYKFYTLEGGFTGWERRGYPVASGGDGSPSGPTNFSTYQTPNTVNKSLSPESNQYYEGNQPEQSGSEGSAPPEHYKDRISYRIRGKRQPRWTRARLIRHADRVGTSIQDIRKRNY